MLKNILNLEGAQQLSKNEQQSIQGGKDPKWCQKPGNNGRQCGGTPDYICIDGECVFCPGC